MTAENSCLRRTVSEDDVTYRRLYGQRANLKTNVSRKQSTPNFPVPGGKKCSFFGKFRVLCFLEATILGFVLWPYYRRINLILVIDQGVN